MTPDNLRTWQVSQGYTYTSAALALGMGRSNYALMLSGQTKIDRRTALACSALAAGRKLCQICGIFGALHCL